MTHRERFEAVCRGKTPDMIPWLGDLTYWHASHQLIGDLPPQWQGPNGLHEMHRELNVGEYIPGTVACDTIEGDDVRREVAEADGRRVIHWRTPVGDLREVQEYSPTSYSWGYMEHAVKSVEDLRTLRHIIASRHYIPCPERFTESDASFAAYGFGPTHIGSPPTPISELNKHWIGVMDLTYLLADEPDEVRQTLDVIAAAHDQIYRIIADNPCWHVMICENLSAETMGGYFDEFIGPHLRRWTGWLHEKSKFALLHNDGTMRGTVEKLAAAGVDCIDSITPKPVGDAGMDEVRKMAGDDIILLGGLPGAMFAPPFTAADIERHVKEVIRLHKDSKKFMFGVADQVPPNGDLKLVRLVGELIEEYGRY